MGQKCDRLQRTRELADTGNGDGGGWRTKADANNIVISKIFDCELGTNSFVDLFPRGE